jgi:hypothetical protein
VERFTRTAFPQYRSAGECRLIATRLSIFKARPCNDSTTQAGLQRRSCIHIPCASSFLSDIGQQNAGQKSRPFEAKSPRANKELRKKK